MANQRHKKNSSKLSHEDKIRELSRRGIIVDPTNPREVSRKYSATKKERLPSSLLTPIPGKKEQRDALAKELRARGFRTTDKKLVIDRPRNRKREPIKGARISVHKGGVVSMRVKQRQDFVYGFTKAEKKKFAENPDLLITEIRKRLQKQFPNMRGRKVQTRLQWGAYRATKDFSADHWFKIGSGKYYEKQTPEMKRRGEKGKLKDRLTGLHFVVHVPSKARKRSVKKNAKTKGKKKS